MERYEIWTIGHSTHTFPVFVEMLQSFSIEMVADIRRFPGSRRYPQFNKDALHESLLENRIGYNHLEGLGGRRKPQPNSNNTGWRVPAFQGYADYMETQDFETAISKLKRLASKKRTVFMCSEAVWWSCHRSVVADYLKFNGWLVMHIMGVGKVQEHPYTKPAIIENNRLVYPSRKPE
jgi:uncharacterized protein (DUF488 family)